MINAGWREGGAGKFVPRTVLDIPDGGPRLRRSGEFADPGTESRFLAERLVGSAGTLGLLSLVAAGGFMAFAPTDLVIMGLGWPWAGALALRCTAAIALLVSGWCVRNRPLRVATETGWRWLLVVEGVCVAAFIAVCLLRPSHVDNLQLSVLVMGTAMLVVVPGPIRHRATTGALLYGLFGMVAVTRFDYDDLAPMPFVGSLILGYGGGLLAATYLARADRLTFYALERARDLNRHLVEQVQEVDHHHQEIARQTVEDALTGLPNRRAFFSQGEALLAYLGPGGRIGCYVFDIDRFRIINDAHGPAGGEAVLRSVAQGFRKVLRGDDIAGRLAGEEFGVLVPVASQDEAVAIAQRIQAAVGNTAVDDPALGQEPVRVTASGGLAMFHPGETLTVLLQRADLAMYRAKAGGGNTLEVAAAP
jgi:diguanylate cyclase (GGDEF)-like protein